MRTASPTQTGHSFTAVTLAGLLYRTGCRYLSRQRDLLTCWLIGHATDWMDPWNCRCFRCGLQWEYGDKIRSDINWYLSLSNLKHRICISDHVRRLGWWYRCPDCGGRYGKHDEAKCIPF